MKVLVVTNKYPPAVAGGYERACNLIVDALLDRGHRVRVLTTAPRIPLDRPIPDEPHVHRVLRLAGVYSHDLQRQSDRLTFRREEASGSFVDAANVYMLGHEIDRFDPDVVYVWNLNGLGGLGVFAVLGYRRVPWVCHLMDAMPMFLCQLDERPLGALAKEMRRWLHGSWIACSSRVLDEIEYGGPPLGGPIELLPVWIPDPPCLDEGVPYRPGETLRLVFAGVVSHYKGAGILLDALALLREQGIEQVALDLIGWVRHSDLQQRAVDLDLSERVTFYGPREQMDVLELMRGHHVLAFPTYEREPFGMVALEGAISGCVPVISESCGAAEWLVDGVHCLKAPATAEGFAGVLRRIAEGKIELGPIARRVRGAAVRDFSAGKVANEVERILNRAAADPPARQGSTLAAYRAAMLAEHVIAASIEESMAA